MRFVHVTDIHAVTTAEECGAIYGVSVDPKRLFLGVARKIISLRPEFVAVTGDIAAMAEKSYVDRVLCWYLTFKEFFIKPLERNGIKVFTIPGNHDINKAFGLDVYRMIFGEENYYVDFNGTRLIFVTPKIKARKCKPSDELLEWLSKIIKPNSLLFSHYPLSLWKRKEDVIGILDGEINGFFSGHLHRMSLPLGGDFPRCKLLPFQEAGGIGGEMKEP